jgi:HD-GYP domain-containing protein (c-di-GMP phosphodiesterase class II)
MEVDAADVLLLNPHTLTLEYAAGRGFRTTGIERTSLRLGEGFAGQAALERRLVSVSNLDSAGKTFLRSSLLSGEDLVAYFGLPLIAKGQIKGVLEIFHRSPIDPDKEWLDFLDTLSSQAAIAIDNGQLFTGLERSNMELSLAYDTTLEGWSRALDLRDKETEGHTKRVTDITVQLARIMGVSEGDLVHIHRGALLHDMGKMGVPDGILFKPGSLSEADWLIMRSHPQFAYDMLSPIQYLRSALDIPYCHHEKWDGTGYPRQLKEEQIPLSARIFAVVDVWDALISDRPYRPAWSKTKALDHIREQSGKHFDPNVVTAFLDLPK